MLSHLRPAATMVVLFTGLCGLAYPLAITGAAQTLMPQQANGSVIKKGDTVIGSALIGQAFTSPRYFAPRPSATATSPYNPLGSGGTNLGATSQKLKDQIAAAVTAWRAAGREGPVPSDAVTSSGSGLDPEISPQNARLQVASVAKARNLPEKEVAALVESQIQPRLFGVIGEHRVNVLSLNLALDQAGPAR